MQTLIAVDLWPIERTCIASSMSILRKTADTRRATNPPIVHE
jgi:hypothetical protein